ncbi:GAF domain-containing protein [Aquipuribacter sp. SD81]|uniref:GAF domain-containing protein n=1 Tax=Aquipuribacter sp. SD81 TaxID=3127703 RepID=UPI00301770AE
MGLLLHLRDTSQSTLPPLDRHLVLSLAVERFHPDDVTADVDLVVVSLEDEVAALELARSIHDGRPGTRVLVRAPGESGPRVVEDGVWVTGAGSVSTRNAVSRMLDGSDADDPRQDEAEPARGRGDERAAGDDVIDLRRQVPRGGGRDLLRQRLGGATAGLGASARAFDLRAPEPVSVEQPVEPIADDADPADGPVEVPAVPTPDQPSVRSRGRESRDDAPEALVARLLPQVDRLYGVKETATAVVEHLRDTVDVAAAAVLVPDQQRWVVAAASGHRHLEERLVLAADHWLVTEVGAAQHAVIVDDTDVARNRLSGAPLSAWAHLLAVPLVSVGGIALLARGPRGPAFTSRDVGAASAAAREANSLFASAVTLRELARRLSQFADEDALELVESSDPRP